MSLDAQNYEENTTEMENGVNEDTDESTDLSSEEELVISAECMLCGYRTGEMKVGLTKQNMRTHLESEHEEDDPESFESSLVKKIMTEKS